LISGPTIYLDLFDPSTWQISGMNHVAYVCAAISRYADCHADPKGSRLLNVTNTTKLIRYLVERGCFVVYVSSNAVFDGSFPHAKTIDPVAPQTEYGRQKAEVEARIAELGCQVCILRVAKVFPKNPPLLTNWIAELRDGKVIHPFRDLSCAPVPLEMVSECLIRLGSTEKEGIWHLSGERDVSYAELAVALAERSNLDASLIEPESVKNSPHYLERAPRFTSLDCSLTADALRIKAPSISDVLSWMMQPDFKVLFTDGSRVTNVI
jgi:dTDP-4-dehydrorhamnose reductase